MRNEKRKARRAKLFQRKNGEGKKSNRPDDEPEEKKSIIIITIVRIDDGEGILILLLFDFLPASQRKFLSLNFHTSKDKKIFRHSNIFF